MSDYDTVITAVPIGSLALRLYAAESELIAAERSLEALLSALYGSYSDWEAGPDGIDVYDVTPSPAAADALFRAGFGAVREHGHGRRSFLRCACGISRRLY